MNITDEMIERVAEIICDTLGGGGSWASYHDNHNVIAIRRYREAATNTLAALGDVEPLESVMNSIPLTEMHVAQLVTGTWQVMVTVEGGEWGEDDQPVGFGKKPGDAIRAAVANAKD